MTRKLVLSMLCLCVIVIPMSAASISGLYVEARTCDVWTGPCYANAEDNLDGKHAVMAWKVEQGSMNDVKLDGLSIVAVIEAGDTLGVPQTRTGKAVLLIDQKATKAQRSALIALAKKQAGPLLKNVIRVRSEKISFEGCPCSGKTCALLKTGTAQIETRCLHAKHDKVCGNESIYYLPLAKGVKAKPAVAVEHSFVGKDLGQTWQDRQRRGAYFGTFLQK